MRCSRRPRSFRWQPERVERAQASWLARVFRGRDGEPMQAQLAHIASLSAGERLWFERGVLDGDTVLAPHEALSDTPVMPMTPAGLCRPRSSRRPAPCTGSLPPALD